MADIVDTLNIASSGLSAQRARLQTITSNMANARSVDANGDPYQRKAPVFQTQELDPFGDALEAAMSTVEVSGVVELDTPTRTIHAPDHPHADADGMVTVADIDILQEMVDMMTTARSYESMTKAAEATLEMAASALEIGR